MKKVIISILIILVLLSGGIFYLFSSRTVYNAEGTTGNTPGNLLNGGLFCEDEGKIYFSNQNDDGSLYVMDSDCTNFKKLYNDKAAYINSAGKYLYYSRKNYEWDKKSQALFVLDNAGVYRIQKNGSRITQLDKERADMLSLSGNYIYYQPFIKEGYQLHQVKLDKKEKKLISKYPFLPASIQNHTLYYAGTEKNHHIYSMNLSGTASNTVYEGNCAFPIVQEDYIYFLDLENNYAITRINLDGSDPTVLVQQRVSTYNLSPSGKYLYYQVDDGENNGLFRFNTETKEEELILAGDYNSIHITGNYVFFNEFNSSKVYVLPVGDAGNVGFFNPPSLKK